MFYTPKVTNSKSTNKNLKRKTLDRYFPASAVTLLISVKSTVPLRTGLKANGKDLKFWKGLQKPSCKPPFARIWDLFFRNDSHRGGLYIKVFLPISIVSSVQLSITRNHQIAFELSRLLASITVFQNPLAI